MRRSICGGVCLLFVSGALPGRLPSAYAADAAEDDLIRQGIELRRRREDAAAFPIFQKAYDLRHSPRAAAQIGLDELALGRWLDADRHLQEAIAAAADPWIRKNRTALQESLERVGRQLGDLEILGGPVGAEIVVEGEVRGKLPLQPMRVRIGPCHVDVRAPHYVSLTRTLEITAGALTRETVNLSPEPAVVVVAPKEMTAGPKTDQARAQTSPARLPADVSASPDDRGRPGLRVAGLVAAGVGVAALGSGLVFGLKARSAGTNDSKAAMFDDTTDRTGHRYQTLQYLGYGIGGALLVGGLATYFLSAPKTGRSDDRMVGISSPAGGGVMAQLGGRF